MAEPYQQQSITKMPSRGAAACSLRRFSTKQLMLGSVEKPWRSPNSARTSLRKPFRALSGALQRVS
eukprot:68868-Alexandrium_andersonii.AAC.1